MLRRGAGDVEGLPPFGQVDEFLADVFEVCHISGVHLAAHRGVEGFAELVLGGLAAADILRFLAGVGPDLSALHLELCQAGVEDALHGLLDDVRLGGSVLPGEPIVEFRPLLAGVEAEESFDDLGGDSALCVDGLVDDHLAHFAFEGGAEVCLGFCADGFPLLAGDGLLAVGPAFHRRRIRIERDALLERWVSRDDSQEIPLLHFKIIHELDIMPDLVHEGHHGRGFATGFDEVGVQGDDALAVRAEAPERIALAGNLHLGAAAGEGFDKLHGLGHLHHRHLVQPTEDERHGPGAIHGTHYAHGVGVVGEDLGVVVGIERGLGDGGRCGHDRPLRSGVGKCHAGLSLLRFLVGRLLALGFVGFALNC